MDRLRPRESTSRSYVGIVVAGTRYAIDVRRVREVVRPAGVTQLPLAVPGLVGIAHLRGEIVPVIDLRHRLEHSAGEERPARPRWVLARTRDARLVVLVADHIEAPFASSARSAAGAGPPVVGVHVRPTGLVLELDVDSLAAPVLAAIGRADGGGG